jgi:hypothetical protein
VSIKNGFLDTCHEAERGHTAPLTPQQAVEGMIHVIDTLTPHHNGRFFTWQGREQVW